MRYFPRVLQCSRARAAGVDARDLALERRVEELVQSVGAGVLRVAVVQRDVLWCAAVAAAGGERGGAGRSRTRWSGSGSLAAGVGTELIQQLVGTGGSAARSRRSAPRAPPAWRPRCGRRPSASGWRRRRPC